MNSLDKSVKLNYSQAPLSARLELLVGNSLHSDFTFILEDEDNVEVPAHKLILALASPVLDRIVYGSDAFTQTNVNTVDGISKKSFMEILRHIYTDKITIDEDNVFEVFHKANYFGLPLIEKICFSYLRENLNTTTVPWIYHHLFHTSSSPELLKKCLQFIRIEPMSFFSAEEFPSLSIDAFKSILQMDAINCTEVNLFEAVINLARAHCIVNGLEPTGANQRKVLDGADNLLRFDSLTESEFDECLSMQPDFFLSNEIERIRNSILNPTLSARRRKWYTYQDSVWMRVALPNDLPPSCFYSGDSNFVYRSQEYAGETAMLSNNFSQLMKELTRDRGREFIIEVLCGSGYEWRECVDGEIPFGAVSLSQKNAKPMFIARGTAYHGMSVGAAYTNGKMYVFSGIQMAETMSTSSSDSDSDREYLAREVISEFEVLVAKNVKNPYTGNGIPSDAIFIGTDENNMQTYLGRAWHSNDLLPAKLLFQNDVSVGTYVPYGTDEVEVDEFSFVRMDPGTYKWEEAQNGEVPVNAIDGGCTSLDETLYFGRVPYNGTYIPGKIHPSHGVFYASHGGREINFSTYEVLVENSD